MEPTNRYRGLVPTSRKWSLLRNRGTRCTNQTNNLTMGIQQYRTNRSFRYCLLRMAPDGSKRKRLIILQAPFQGSRQGPPAHGHHRHCRISRLSTLGAHHEHPDHYHPSRPCRQRTGPSQSPSPSISIVRLECCLGCEHLRYHSSLVWRTTSWLLLDSWPHYKQ
jgi:hypothetical protein